MAKTNYQHRYNRVNSTPVVPVTTMKAKQSYLSIEELSATPQKMLSTYNDSDFVKDSKTTSAKAQDTSQAPATDVETVI